MNEKLFSKTLLLIVIDLLVLTSDNNNCEPLISINDVKAEGGNDENNVDIKLFVGTDTWNQF